MNEKSDSPGPTPTFPAGEIESGPPVRRIGATIITGISLIVAVIYAWMAFNMPGGSLSSPGAGAWPRIVGVAWIGISALTVFESFKKVQISPQDLLPTGDKLKLVLLFFAATVVYIIAIPFLGIYISSSVYAIYTIGLMRSRWTFKLVLVGLVFGVATSFIFVELLEVRLPPFPW